jgi:hypothetical protein
MRGADLCLRILDHSGYADSPWRRAIAPPRRLVRPAWSRD